MVKLRRAHAIGPLAQLDLERLDSAELIEAVIPNERYRALDLKEGETLVVKPRRMQVFVDFCRKFGIPYAELMAPLSVYWQFVAGIGFVLGLLTRWLGLITAVVLNVSRTRSGCRAPKF